jgi:hypothetical protein
MAEHWPLAAHRHDPPLVLAVVQHTVPEHVERLPLAYIVQSQSPEFAPDSHLITLHWHEPEAGQPGSAQQMPGAPSTAGLQGTVLEGPTVSHEHEPSTLTYMSLHAIPPPPDDMPPELPPEPEPEEEEETPPDDPPELLPPDDPDEELADASPPEGLPLPEHPPLGTASTSAAAAVESARTRARRIGPFYALRPLGLPSQAVRRSEGEAHVGDLLSRKEAVGAGAAGETQVVRRAGDEAR